VCACFFKQTDGPPIGYATNFGLLPRTTKVCCECKTKTNLTR